MHVSDHADDLIVAVGTVADVEATADRIFVQEIPSHERIVDDRHHRCFLGVAIVERASAEERNAEGTEVVGADGAMVCRRGFARLGRRPALDFERQHVVAAHRHRLDHRR
jgi:hypothetical protein